MLYLTDIGIFYSLHMGNDVVIANNLDLFINFYFFAEDFFVTCLQLLEFYQMAKPHHQIQRVKLRIIKMPMSGKENCNFRNGAESMNHQVINSFIGARMVLFFYFIFQANYLMLLNADSLRTKHESLAVEVP